MWLCWNKSLILFKNENIKMGDEKEIKGSRLFKICFWSLVKSLELFFLISICCIRIFLFGLLFLLLLNEVVNKIKKKIKFLILIVRGEK